MFGQMKIRQNNPLTNLIRLLELVKNRIFREKPLSYSQHDEPTILESSTNIQSQSPNVQSSNIDKNTLLRICKTLYDYRIEYSLIGGAAMWVHGFGRRFQDIDMFIRDEKNNIARLCEALSCLWPKMRSSEFRTENMQKNSQFVFHAADGTRMDIFREIPGIYKNEDVLDCSEYIYIEGIQVQVITRIFLVEMKTDTGRLKDAKDLIILNGMKSTDSPNKFWQEVLKHISYAESYIHHNPPNVTEASKSVVEAAGFAKLAIDQYRSSSTDPSILKILQAIEHPTIPKPETIQGIQRKMSTILCILQDKFYEDHRAC